MKLKYTLADSHAVSAFKVQTKKGTQEDTRNTLLNILWVI